MAALLVAGSTDAARADATLTRIKDRGRLAVGIILSGPPFGYIDPESRDEKGLNIDLAHALADKLGVTLEMITVTPPNRVQFLQQGKVDILIANMQFTEARAKILDFVPTPYDRSGGGALARKDSGIKDWTDLRGKPVCVSQGSNFTQPLVERYGVVIRALPSQPESMLALKGGNCVAAVHVGATVGLIVRDHPEEWKDYAIVIPSEIIPSDSVIWLRKGDSDTKAALDDAVKDLHRTGRLLAFAQANRLLDTTFLKDEQARLSKAAN